MDLHGAWNAFWINNRYIFNHFHTLDDDDFRLVCIESCRHPVDVVRFLFTPMSIFDFRYNYSSLKNVSDWFARTQSLLFHIWCMHCTSDSNECVALFYRFRCMRRVYVVLLFEFSVLVYSFAFPSNRSSKLWVYSLLLIVFLYRVCVTFSSRQTMRRKSMFRSHAFAYQLDWVNVV